MFFLTICDILMISRTLMIWRCCIWMNLLNF
nr:MAG TPA: hypothetical protein [Caudoviricetes sp.]